MEKEFDVKTVLAWTAPKDDGAPIITMPNVPTPLHMQCPGKIIGK